MKVLTKILAACFCTIVLLFAVLQAQRLFSPPYRTETALSYTAADEITAVGIALRNETALDTQKSNVVGYLYEDGSKVAKDVLVTEIYQDRSTIAKKAEISALEREIQMLQDAQLNGSSFIASTETLTSQLKTSTMTLSKLGRQGDLSGLEEERLNFLSLLNKKMIATEKESSYESRILALTRKKEAMEASLPDPVELVYMPQTGYFSSVTDGHEETCSLENVLDMQVEDISQLVLSCGQQEEVSIGKVIKDFKWYFVVVVSQEEANRLVRSGTVSVSFPYLNVEDVEMEYYTQVKQPDSDPNDDQEQMAVVFTCKEMNRELSGLRAQSARLAVRSYTGLRISKEAIRFENSVKGVYVLIGQTLRFKPIEDQILYEEKDYVLCKDMSGSITATNALMLYDEVVVEGKDLYDGKTY